MASHRENFEHIRQQDEAGEVSRQRTIARLYDEVIALLAENEQLQVRVNHLETRVRQLAAMIERRDGA